MIDKQVQMATQIQAYSIADDNKNIAASKGPFSQSQLSMAVHLQRETSATRVGNNVGN